MCKLGDIIVINNYNNNGANLSKHSFVVINDEAGQIQSLDYDIICNVLSSFKSEEQRKKKLQYPRNFPITHNYTSIDNGNTKNGFIKAEQFYYFNKAKIEFDVIGSLNDDVFELLIKFINELEIDIQDVLDNL